MVLTIQNNEIPTAVVTGANGFVGSRVCRDLCKNGYRVRALHRLQSDLSALQGMPVERVAGDIEDKDSLRRAFEGADIVLHVAALFRSAKHPDEVYHQVNVEGTRNVFEAAHGEQVERVVHCSTVGVHSHISDPPADEEEPYRPDDIYQHTKCEGEKVALHHLRERGMGGVVLRPAMVWGPRDLRTLKLFRGIAKERFPLIGDGKTLLHWVLVDDLARAFRLAADAKDRNGEVYIVAGERPVSLNELVAAIAKNFGVSPPRIRIPATPVQLLGSLIESICKPFGIEPPLYRRRVDFFTKTRAFNWNKARRHLGYRPALSFEKELALICEWYRDHSWIS